MCEHFILHPFRIDIEVVLPLPKELYRCGLLRVWQREYRSGSSAQTIRHKDLGFDVERRWRRKESALIRELSLEDFMAGAFTLFGGHISPTLLRRPYTSLQYLVALRMQKEEDEKIKTVA